MGSHEAELVSHLSARYRKDYKCFELFRTFGRYLGVETRDAVVESESFAIRTDRASRKLGQKDLEKRPLVNLASLLKGKSTSKVIDRKFLKRIEVPEALSNYASLMFGSAALWDTTSHGEHSGNINMNFESTVPH